MERLQGIPWLKIKGFRLETSTNVSLISESMWRFPSSKWLQNVWNAEEGQAAQRVTKWAVSDYCFRTRCFGKKISS